jgi:Ca2+-binding RTX toxin-like protein
MATYTGNAFANSYVGTAQADTIDMRAGDDIAYGQGGDDTIYGGWGDDSLHGGADDDILMGDRGDDLLFGDAGSDHLLGGDGNDFMHGGDDVDLVEGNDGEDTLFGDGGDDRLVGGADDDILHGGEDRDDLEGGADNDQLFGDDDNDHLEGGAGADLLDGGVGDIDFAVYASSAAAVTVNLATGATSGGDAAGDTLVSIEGVVGSDFADTLTGDSSFNFFEGGKGADRIDGGGGIDRALYISSNAAVTVNLATGLGSGGDAACDVLTRIEEVWGSAFNDVLTGDAGANLLFGDRGDDTLEGGAGADDLDGMTGIDTASYAHAAAGVVVDLVLGGSSGDAAGDTFRNIDRVTGSAFDDTLAGSAGDNQLDGGNGADVLIGGGGTDVMIGGLGDDTYVVDSTGDQAVETTSSASGGNDTVHASASFTLGSFIETLVLIEGTGNLNGTGNLQANTILGNSGNNVINGGGGADTLSGNGGNDTFVFGAGQANGDTISDFEGNGTAAGDFIQFTGFGIAALGATFTQVDATTWQIHSAIDGHNEFITLSNGATVDTSDFLFV